MNIILGPQDREVIILLLMPYRSRDQKLFQSWRLQVGQVNFEV